MFSQLDVETDLRILVPSTFNTYYKKLLETKETWSDRFRKKNTSSIQHDIIFDPRKYIVVAENACEESFAKRQLQPIIFIVLVHNLKSCPCFLFLSNQSKKLSFPFSQTYRLIDIVLFYPKTVYLFPSKEEPRTRM